MNKTMATRRDFIRNTLVAAAALPLITSCRSSAFAGDTSSDLLALIKKNAIQDVNGEWSGAISAPADVSWKTVLSNETNKGEPMEISGTVFQADGKTPASNTLIYLYHTDLYGIYGRGDEHRHGRYRSWILTDSRGRYEFESIRPAPYPENRFAAHVHMTVTTKDSKEDWIDSILFDGDRLISPQERNLAGRKGGFNPILTFKKGANGVLNAERNIQLAKG
jgi:protocatechuate 3,4-dioxygenase, beta subunit